jgi:creatinine amidohydrolase
MAGDPGSDPLPPLESARWAQVDESARQVLLWPLGSTEQHGPHLPLNTDTVIASALAKAAHARLPQLGLAPALPYGASGEHAHFPGTLSIGTPALTSVIVEFVRHAALSWQHVLVVNGHGGNAEALQGASDVLRYEKRSLTIWHAASSGSRADAHAGYRETSLILFLRPDAVRMDLAAPGVTEHLGDLLDLIHIGGVRAVSPNGVLGDPTGANAERGQKIFDEMTDRLVATIQGVGVPGP